MRSRSSASGALPFGDLGPHLRVARSPDPFRGLRQLRLPAGLRRPFCLEAPRFGVQPQALCFSGRTRGFGRLRRFDLAHSRVLVRLLLR